MPPLLVITSSPAADTPPGTMHCGLVTIGLPMREQRSTGEQPTFNHSETGEAYARSPFFVRNVPVPFTDGEKRCACSCAKYGPRRVPG